MAEREPINLGSDFPRSRAELQRREEIAEWLERALNCIRHDPIAGNAGYCIERAYDLMRTDSGGK